MDYAVQYTISVLTGAYALKYSVVIYHAARFAGLLKATDSELVDLADDAPKRDYDPYVCFQALMKMIRKYAKKSFCTAIERRQGDRVETAPQFDDEDEMGAFTVRAYGFKGMCERQGECTHFDEITGKNGTYVAKYEKVMEHFRKDLENLLNLSEETMAKDARLVVETVPNDTPAPQPLFRL